MQITLSLMINYLYYKKLLFKLFILQKNIIAINILINFKIFKNKMFVYIINF